MSVAIPRIDIGSILDTVKDVTEVARTVKDTLDMFKGGGSRKPAPTPPAQPETLPPRISSGQTAPQTKTTQIEDIATGGSMTMLLVVGAILWFVFRR